MLKPIGIQTKFGPTQIVCVHWRDFPPKAYILEVIQGKSIEQLRTEGAVSPVEYQKYLVWKRICGLGAMKKQKCRHCEHVRRLAPPDDKGLIMLTKLDGSCPIPIVDLPTLENRRSRSTVQAVHSQTPLKRQT